MAGRLFSSGGCSSYQPPLPVRRSQDQRRRDPQGPRDGAGVKTFGRLGSSCQHRFSPGRCYRGVPGADWRGGAGEGRRGAGVDWRGGGGGRRGAGVRGLCTWSSTQLQ